MTENKDLAPLKAQVSKIENQATAVVIETAEDYANAADLIARLKDTGSKIKNQKESITKPLNEALKSARELFAPIEEQFANAETILKGKILAYNKKVNEAARAEEAKIAARVEKGTLKVETAEKKMANVERVETTTRGAVGQVQIKKVRKVRITNEALIPRNYLIPDNVLIRKDALSGIAIPGVEVYEEEQVAAGSF